MSLFFVIYSIAPQISRLINLVIIFFIRTNYILKCSEALENRNSNNKRDIKMIQ